MDGFRRSLGGYAGDAPVAFRIAAGRPAPRPLEAGEAMGIATGGVVPEGADAVVPIEYVVDHDNSVEIGDPVAVGANVREAGGDIRAGEVVLAAGVRIGPAQVGAAAAAGVGELVCGRRPRVALLATGTELQPPGTPLSPGQVYEANSYLLEAQLAAAGAVPERLTAVEDDRTALRTALERGSRRTSSSRRGACPWGRTTSFARRQPPSASRRCSGVLPSSPGNRSSSVCAGRRSSSACRATRSPRSSASSCSFGLPSWRSRASPSRCHSSSRAIRSPSVETRTGTSSYAHGPLGRTWTVSLAPLRGQESHMIARAAAADVLVFVPRGTGELPAGTSVDYLRLAS